MRLSTWPQLRRHCSSASPGEKTVGAIKPLEELGNPLGIPWEFVGNPLDALDRHTMAHPESHREPVVVVKSFTSWTLTAGTRTTCSFKLDGSLLPR